MVDLSHDVRQIKALTGDRGEHFNRIVTEIETLGHGCGETCSRVEDELRRLKNHTQSGLDRLQVHIKTLQGRVASDQGSCSQVCSNLQEEVGKLRQDVERCTGQCKNGLDTSTGWLPCSIHPHTSMGRFIHPYIHTSIYILHAFIRPSICMNQVIHRTDGGSGGSGGTGLSGGGLGVEKPLDGHSVIGGTQNNNQLKRLQGELSEVLLTFSSINDTLKGLEHTVHKHGSVITDLGEEGGDP